MEEQELIKILLDENASISERDDASMDLSEFDSINVVKALILVGSDSSVDEVILSSVGESLAEIWLRNKNFNIDDYQKLTNVAKFAIRENMGDEFPNGLIE